MEFYVESVILTETDRGLKKKLCNVVDQLSTNLINQDNEHKPIIKNNYDKESLNNFNGKKEYIIVPNDDSDLSHEYSKK